MIWTADRRRLTLRLRRTSIVLAKKGSPAESAPRSHVCGSLRKRFTDVDSTGGLRGLGAEERDAILRRNRMNPQMSVVETVQDSADHIGDAGNRGIRAQRGETTSVQSVYLLNELYIDVQRIAFIRSFTVKYWALILANLLVFVQLIKQV